MIERSLLEPHSEISMPQPKYYASRGLTFVGTEAGCGKTAIMAGLARLLQDQGQSLRAIKPIAVGAREKLERELSFLSLVTATPRNYGASCVEDQEASDSYWNEALSISRSSSFTLVETCGSAVTPICFETGLDTIRLENERPNTSIGERLPSAAGKPGAKPKGSPGAAGGKFGKIEEFNKESPRHTFSRLAGQKPGRHWRDSRDLACELGFPCILVARHNQEAIERLLLTASYLTSGDKCDLVGLVTVECAPQEGQLLESRLSRSDLEMLLASRIKAPFLGTLKYSPSISVTRVNQGNLVKVTEAGIDLLAFRRAINLPLTP